MVWMQNDATPGNQNLFLFCLNWAQCIHCCAVVLLCSAKLGAIAEQLQKITVGFYGTHCVCMTPKPIQTRLKLQHSIA